MRPERHDRYLLGPECERTDRRRHTDVDFTAIGAGAEHSCGLSTTGDLVCWGKNDNGRADSRSGPFRALAVGIAHTCVLREDSTALCQGENADGQSTPPGTVFAAISAGSNHTCGTLPSLYVECWGGTRSDASRTSFGPSGQLNSVSAGWLDACATNRDGQVACWPTTVRDPPQAPYTRLLLADIAPGHTFSQPTEVFPWPDGGLAIADRAGSLVVLTPDLSITPLLDLTDIVSTSGEERGLLSAAVSPHFEWSKYIYVYYTVEDPNDRELLIARLSRFPVVEGRPLRTRELIILELPRYDKGAGHYGGAIRFGPDGLLYLGIGDASCFECPQDLESLFGKIIRIDVRESSVDAPYSVPEDNPIPATPGTRSEIWAFGMRNPWRMSFDPNDGRLWVGDVGDASTEELNIVEAGANLGWPIYEGYDCFVPSSSTMEDYEIESGLPCTGSEAFKMPEITYDHTGRCAIVGGIVYEGIAMPWLRGTYVFGDFCSGEIWALDGDAESGWRMVEIADLDKPLSSFGVDTDKEILVLTFSGPILRLVEGDPDYAPSVTHAPEWTILTDASSSFSYSAFGSP